MRGRRVAWLLLLTSVLACSDAPPLHLSDPVFGPGTVRFELVVVRGYVPGSLRVHLDGMPVEVDTRTLTPDSIFPIVMEVGWGPHYLVVSAEQDDGGERKTRRVSRLFRAPRGAPRLLVATPADGAEDVAREAWLELVFAEPVDPELLAALELTCGGRHRRIRVTPVAAGRVVVAPLDLLPARGRCQLWWRGADGPLSLDFNTQARRAPVTVIYDRGDPESVAPFPDDYWTERDTTSATGLRVAMPVPDRPGVDEAFASLLAQVNGRDGWSPIAHLVFETAAPLDPQSVPRTAAESVDPMASVVLLDVDPESPGYGERIPFRLVPRRDVAGNGLAGHGAMIFPSLPLRHGGSYGLIVTRRARGLAGRALGPSPWMWHALDPDPQAGADPVLRGPGPARARWLAQSVLATASQALDPPLQARDVALAVRFTVGTLPDVAALQLRVREHVLASPPPRFTIERVEASADAGSPLAAAVHGVWEPPDLARVLGESGEGLAGRPQAIAHAIPFTLALPRDALVRRVPVVMYQHGNPGSAAQEITGPPVEHLLRAGFAVAGFTDVLNREISARHGYEPWSSITAQALELLVGTLISDRVPGYWARTNAEQLAFLRLLPELARLDLLPMRRPDGRSEIDAGAPVGYLGVSEGANLAPGLLPYAPEIGAAVLVAGGARIAEVMIHQASERLLRTLPIALPEMRPMDLWVGLALFQTALDPQDAHNHAHLLYRAPVDLAGEPQRASVLLVSGAGDGYVPGNATASLAWQLGPLPRLAPVAEGLPHLAAVSGPIRANVDARTTAGWVEYVPAGLAGATPTPGCVPPAIHPENAGEGHFCAQLAQESRRQQANFLLSALRDGAPVITRADGD